MKSLIAAAALLLLPLPALAADMVSPDSIVMPEGDAFTWTGLYVGAHAGYGFGETDSNLESVLGFSSPLSELDVDGIVGGAHVGYAHQMGAIVFGLEADFDASGMDGSGTDNNPLFIGPVNGEFSLLWQGSVRARLGYAVDRMLVYGTGGFAYGNAEVSASVGNLSASEKNVLTGWTVGAGVEYAFTDALSARLEYRYTDLGEATYSATTGIGAGSAKFGVTYSQVLAGVSYKF